jgi:D-3-phosphoglycerate dehydrogenase
MKVLYLGPSDTLTHVCSSLPGFDVQLALDETEVDQALPSVEAVLDAYMQVRFTAERLAPVVRLQLFVTATTGADHIDASTLAQRGIPLLTLQGQRQVLRNITPAAEHSWLLLLACSRRLAPAFQHVLRGEWNRNQFPGIMLRGKTLGIIGCGRIGQWMACYATAFGMPCLGYDPYVAHWPEGIEKSDLDSLLGRSDFITVHVPLQEETRRLLGPREFQRVKHGAILINTSRGDIIDEAALLAALRDGRIAAAGLDVLTGEPEIAQHPLVEYAREHENLIITPHIGGFSPDALRYVLSFSCQRIVEFFTKRHERAHPASR